jgi:exosome complex component CSL4
MHFDVQCHAYQFYNFLKRRQASYFYNSPSVMPSPIPTLRHSIGEIVIPGDFLGQAMTRSATDQQRVRVIPGPGTYSRGGKIFAAVVGTLNIESIEESPESSDSQCVKVYLQPEVGSEAAQQILLTGQIVLARVTRITTQQVLLDVFANPFGMLQNDRPEACIRREDVRSGVDPESSSSDLSKSFRPGDWVIARILSLGDTRRYLLSTAEPALGVLQAISSVSGKPMIPISYKEMECPETRVKEPRKCARPQNVSSDVITKLLQDENKLSVSDATK